MDLVIRDARVMDGTGGSSLRVDGGNRTGVRPTQPERTPS
jgi:hypothetical protein